MTYLLFKILTLLALAAVCGAALMHYWLKRRMRDVTVEHSRLIERTSRVSLTDEVHARLGAVGDQHDALIARIEALAAELRSGPPLRAAIEPAPAGSDPAALDRRLTGLSEAIAALKPTDLSALDRKVASLTTVVAALKPTDLSELNRKMAGLTTAVAALKPTELSAPDPRGLHPGAALAAQRPDLAALEARVADLHAALAAIKPVDVSLLEVKMTRLGTAIAALQPTDLAPLSWEVSQVQAAIASLQPTDVAPLVAAVDSLEQRAARISAQVEALRPSDLAETERRLSAIEAHLAAMTAPDLGPVMAHLGSLRSAMATTPAVDLSALDQFGHELAALRAEVTGVRTALTDLPAIDVGPLAAKVDAVARAVTELPPPTAFDTAQLEERLRMIERTITNDKTAAIDLGPLQQRLDALAARPVLDLATVTAEVHALGETVTRTRVDLQPTERRLAAIEHAVTGLPRCDQTTMLGRLDRLTALRARIDQLEPLLHGLGAPDLTPVRAQVDAVDQKVDRLFPLLLALQHADPAHEPDLGEHLRDGTRNLLSSAVFGPADQLQRIKGVGPVLEQLLHRIGVYYFWQIAAWHTADIRKVDDLLDAFKGRIERDEWVPQSRTMAHEPGSARKPVARVPTQQSVGPNRGS